MKTWKVRIIFTFIAPFVHGFSIANVLNFIYYLYQFNTALVRVDYFIVLNNPCTTWYYALYYSNNLTKKKLKVRILIKKQKLCVSPQNTWSVSEL